MSAKDEEKLAELIGTEEDAPARPTRNWRANVSAPAPEEKKEEKKPETYCQWALGANGRFIPVGKTIERVPAGIYSPFADMNSFGLELMSISSDGIYALPDMATELVMDEAEKFWTSEEKYRRHNLLYKRGILLFGPPGGGKTVTVKMLMHELVQRDGIVMVIQSIGAALTVIKALRRVEPDRNLITVFEDIDEIINYQGEANVLSMLDGEHNVDNILQIATTNYAERLGPRIINRPSRFDRRVFVGMPEAPARKVYFQKATQDGLGEEQLELWVRDTEGMSIAHLRELVASVYCLDQDYADVIARLQAMRKAIKDQSGMKSEKLGFGAERAKSAASPA